MIVEVSRLWSQIFYSILSPFKKILSKIVKCIERPETLWSKNVFDDLDRKLLQKDLYRNCYESYEKLSETCTYYFKPPHPFKRKEWCNHVHFMTKELSKKIMEKSKTKNKYLKYVAKSLKTSEFIDQESKESFISRKLQKMRLHLIKKSGLLSNFF